MAKKTQTTKTSAKKTSDKNSAGKKARSAKDDGTTVLAARDITIDTFKDHVGSTFVVNVFGGRDETGVVHPGRDVELTLIACEKARGDRGDMDIEHAEIVNRVPFLVTFQGPDHFPFADQMYTLTHAKLGTIKDIGMSVDRCKNNVKTMLSAHFL